MATKAATLFLLALLALPAAGDIPILGHWQLDAELSDDVQEQLPDKQHKKKKKKKKHGGKHPPGHQQAKPPPLLAATTLQIEANDKQIEITPDRGKTLLVVPNGHAAPVSLSNWGESEAAPMQFGTWEDDTLVMERTLEGGTHVIQSYYVNSDGLLVQDTEVQRPPADSVVVKRYFRSMQAETNPGAKEHP